ncbi:hypothetical protein [Speluncibacter jeojiensis]|uniref:Uncharacterized protein n=1 Tax=Speluncibacter jeojiensis TaxID=2710754 RepID=A0A9X4REQ5_9ACTN|nr:hypothetical protein [Corynebacteriales bacterium D3-21]
MSVPAKDAPRGSGRNAHKETGQLSVMIRTYRFFVGLHQLDDRTPHVPTPKELDEQRKWEWKRPPRWDFTPGKRLRLCLYADLHYGWDRKWADSKTRSVLEAGLPEALQAMEDAADKEDARKAAERAALEESHRRREAAEQLIGARHAENVRGEVLEQQLAQWQHVTVLRQYLDAMAATIDLLTDEQDRASATEWLHWCRRHVDSRDPLARPIAMPPIRRPTWQERAGLLDQIMTELAGQSVPPRG